MFSKCKSDFKTINDKAHLYPLTGGQSLQLQLLSTIAHGLL